MKPEITQEEFQEYEKAFSDALHTGTGVTITSGDGDVKHISWDDFKMKPELSLNARLAMEFYGYRHPYRPEGTQTKWVYEEFPGASLTRTDNVPDYENDNLAAFALLEKAKRDGKIIGYALVSRKIFEARIMFQNGHPLMDENWISARNVNSLSKAITKALAQLFPEETK